MFFLTNFLGLLYKLIFSFQFCRRQTAVADVKIALGLKFAVLLSSCEPIRPTRLINYCIRPICIAKDNLGPIRP